MVCLRSLMHYTKLSCKCWYCCDLVLVFHLSEKLDELSNRDGNLQSMDQMRKFERRTRALEAEEGRKKELDLYSSLSVNELHEKIRKLRLAFNCLKAGHGINNGYSRRASQTCRKKHHTLQKRRLHFFWATN